MPSTASNAEIIHTHATYITSIDKEYDFIIIGDHSIGKSTFLQKYTNTKSPVTPTLGIDFKSVVLHRNDKRYRLRIWDTAGQERFKAMTSAFYRKAQGAIIMYDVNRPNTFNSVISWYDLLRSKGHPLCEVLLIGNKIDTLKSSLNSPASSFESTKQSYITTQHGLALASKLKSNFVETSAIENLKVTEAVETLLTQVLEAEELKYSRKKSIFEKKLDLKKTSDNQKPFKESEKDKSQAYCQCL